MIYEKMRRRMVNPDICRLLISQFKREKYHNAEKKYSQQLKKCFKFIFSFLCGISSFLSNTHCVAE